MVDEETQPSKSELEKLLEELLSTGNELEPESILLALNPAGFDQEAFNCRLKARLEIEAQELRDNGQEVPTHDFNHSISRPLSSIYRLGQPFAAPVTSSAKGKNHPPYLKPSPSFSSLLCSLRIN